MLRIVAGRWGGRRIAPPADARVRPTAERVREAWLSIIGDRIEEATVLDLCAGSGALAFEALSRGARRATVVDVSGKSLAAIRGNAALLDAGALLDVRRGDALRFVEQLAPGAFDVAFADPPYSHDLATQLAARWVARPFATIFGIEHASRVTLPAGGRARRYGDSTLTFYGLDGGPPSPAIDG